MRDVMVNVINDWKKDQAALRDRFDGNKDGNKDGNIDQQEWEVARSEAHAAAQQIHDELALEPDTSIMAKPNNPSWPFIISMYPQALLARKYRRSGYAALVACILSICAAA
jgi:hypothetical protein